MNQVNPIGTHTGPWTFEQALTCMKAGGKVRRTCWATDPGDWNGRNVGPDFITLRDGRFWDDDDREYSITTRDILANDWEPVS